jgi:hypothetical protein
MDMSNIDPIADDAPTPDDFEDGETADTVYRTSRRRLIAVDFDGGRYCIDCASEEYIELCLGDPREIPYGGPVPEGSEVDCPGSSCDHCLRKIEGETILHYDDVCGEYCPERVPVTEYVERHFGGEYDDPGAVLVIPTGEDVPDIDDVLREAFDNMAAEYAAASEDDDPAIRKGSLLQELIAQLNQQRDD